MVEGENSQVCAKPWAAQYENIVSEYENAANEYENTTIIPNIQRLNSTPAAIYFYKKNVLQF